MPQSSSMQQRFFVWLSDNPGEAILRWIFLSVVTVTIAALAVDLAGMNGWGAKPDPAATPAEIRQDSPALDLPSMVPSILAPLLPGGDKRLLPLPPPDGPTAKPMTFELVSGGKLMATGTITPGISEAFAAEVSRHGEYIKTVVLSSPGGSVADALTMGRLIREKKFATEVEAGKFCASSCPLVVAAGVDSRTCDDICWDEDAFVMWTCWNYRRRTALYAITGGCHANVYRNDPGYAAAGRGRLHLRLDGDLVGRQRSGRAAQPYHRELGRRRG